MADPCAGLTGTALAVCRLRNPEGEAAQAPPSANAQAGTEPGTRPLSYYVGRPMLDPLTGQIGTLKFTADRRGDRYTLVDDQGKVIHSVQRGSNLLDPVTLGLVAIGSNFNLTNEAKASQSDLERFGLTASDGSGSGSEYHAQPYGYAAPDPAAAINGLMAQYEAQVQAGMMPREQALQQFSAELEAYNSNLDRAEAMNRDIRERSIAEAGRKTDLNAEATSRATSIAQNIIPSMTAGNAPSFMLPFLGNVQANQVNVPELYGQQMPSLASQWDAGIPQVNAFDFPGTIAAPQLPQYQAPQLPDISGLISQLQSGSGPLGFA